MKHEAGSDYFFVPQITLDEVGGTSILAVQLAWNDSSMCNFEEALQTYDASLLQAKHSCCTKSGGCSSKHISSTLGKFNTLEDENIQMVCTPLQLVRNYLGPSNVELKEVTCCSSQFFVRLSPSLAIANNMCHCNHLNEVEYIKQKWANINFLWASLIIEECNRLGLTYFCIAPGSRSSPLAIAASTHPTTTCIACIDERSLSFHAVGYAKGSQRPAVVITSSGTAVSNLHPAIVEASQEFVPLLVLTADRPPELQDVGANQAINQVNHFGPYVRHFFNLPTPTDDISARMLLTTVDYAVNIATSSPCGPVHINCPFREPLDNSPKTWKPWCLSGLNVWMSTAKPFTRYFQVEHPFECSYADRDMAEVLQVIQMANKGLLLLGAIHGDDDVWAALLLAKHLSWPVVVDILSGLRLRKYIDHFPGIENKVLFIDHLDHLLLSDSVKDWMQADVIIQIGSRITSKRISQMLESCFPCSYIMVDKHPSRHDPLHIVTHRIQTTITRFANCLLKACVPHTGNQWRGFLQVLNTTAAWEISLLINSENSLTEPYVAHILLEAICSESAIFFGNSMPIRDADMYGWNGPECDHNLAIKMGSGSCHYIQVGANRGASGIDGLLSTAIGYAVGCNKRLLSVIGDVSFLHDTNGLSLLRQKIPRKPMAIVVINNRGGAIFSLLPVANNTARNILDQYFYTTHDVSVRNLCMAHGVKHVQVGSKMDLRDALFASKTQNEDCVIEINSSIDGNASFHSTLRKFTRQAVDHALSSLSRISVSGFLVDGFMLYKVGKMEYSLYRVQLCSPPTSASASNKSSAFFREGFIISLSLADGGTGFGEVAPLEIHKENLFDVEEQLQFLTHSIEGVTIQQFLPLLKGSFSSWLWHTLGIPPSSIFPSVRCGLEMAVLNAIAASEGSSLLNILHPQTVELSGRPLDVKICALLDCIGSPKEIACMAADLVKEGFTALKLKVARHHDPNQDASVVQEIRKKIGGEIELRADANRNWSYEEAIQFAHSVKDYCLQYIEEPVNSEEDIIRFYEATGLPVALDETINNYRENHFEMLSKYTHPGIVAFVIKPSVIGGFENAALVARWAQQLGKNAVISATYETSLGLSAYVQFSRFIDLQNLDILRITSKEENPSIAHGLGTYKWFKEDVSTLPLVTRCNPSYAFMEASVADADRLLKEFQFNQKAIVRSSTNAEVSTYQLKTDLDSVSISINVHEIGESANNNVIVFLHGFLGTGEDWIPIMKAMSGSARCISIDLPGHGRSKLQDRAGNDVMDESTFSIEAIATILCNLLGKLHFKKVILVGYSMGARIALYMALRCNATVEGAVIISGSPGLTNPVERKMRRAKDDFTASFLVSSGLESFIDTWYAGDLWNSLRCHPHFKNIVSIRLQHDNLGTLARVLSDLSIGRQPPLWEDLKHCKLQLLLIVGERDAKFKTIAQKMHDEINQNATVDCPEMIEIPCCGHAAHLENPLRVISAISQFMRKVKNIVD
ncbi:protein PHYLLO, chloroplastic isoform X2 [Ipomoea triloba]|nr:protein PHYLLO, chloroplastic isoform X2 [Ipomoea triloba]